MVAPMSAEQDPASQPDRIGPYRILETLGEGGMGIVYLAEQTHPIRRRVALKLIKLGMDSKAVLTRFDAERQALALMEHENIAKVLDAGLAENGRPYFAMEYVNGPSLTQYCQEQHLGLRDRLELFRQICAGVQHAHQKGVIHRDLKPANVLITQNEGQPVPKIIDFGLARATNQRLVEATMFTEQGQVLGTPAYMSPEQARGDVRHLDHRTDVYSLGATLYDILTGKPPFDDDAIVKILIKVVNDPPLPLRAHDPKLPEALELIVSKCLNKEAAQRYPTAQALADDLDRFLLAGRVAARRLGYGYRIRYFARHNRALFSLGVALSISIFCLAGFFTYTRIMSARKAAQARRQAELSRELGKEIKDLEWLMRAAYALPLHDIEREKAEVRRRMAELAKRFAKLGEAGEGAETTAGLVAYGLGRGHLALHEYKQAYEQLVRAQTLGTSLPELHLALGRVQGELFAKALQDARRSGDASFFEKRRQELEKQYLEPALAHLAAVKRSGARVESPHFLEGLIAFYTKHGDEALKHADAALAQDGWLYEAKKLSADVIQSRALDEKDGGQHEQAEKDFAEAIKRYEQAADIARSDHEIYEAIAESYIRQMEIDVDRGRDPSVKQVEALHATDKAIAASSKDSLGYTKKAFIYSFQAKYHLIKEETSKMQAYTNKQIEFGQLAIVLNPKDAYAHEIVGLGYFQKSQIVQDEPVKDNLRMARKFISSAFEIDPRFSWAYNDLAIMYLAEFVFDTQIGEADITSLKEAKKHLAKAIQIDEKYFFAYSNLAEANRLLTQWQVEHGQDPRDSVDQAIESANQSLEINKNNPYALGAIGEVYRWQALYDQMVGEEVDNDVEHSIAAFDKLISINSRNAVNYGGLAQAYFIKARYATREGLQAQRLGMETIAKCYKLDPRWAPCLWTEGLLLAETNWQLAVATVRKSIQSASPERVAEANFILAAIIYGRANGKGQTTSVPRPLLDEGLVAMKQALKQNRTWPRALALQGGLAWLRAKQETDPARRSEFVRLSGDSFKWAFKGNPLLKRQYEGVLGELLSTPSRN